MLPIGPLMIEHRLIERLMPLITEEVRRLEDNIAVDPRFAFVDAWVIDVVVDFMQTYADHCHHGKEEGILFAALEKKDLRPEHRRIMAELTQEHVHGRQLTRSLAAAKKHYLQGDEAVLPDIIHNLKTLAAHYPPHIVKEDKHFFLPCMAYFSDAEKADMLGRMWEFDRRVIHDKYNRILEQLQKSHPCEHG